MYMVMTVLVCGESSVYMVMTESAGVWRLYAVCIWS